jgi:hypothetical protein
MVTELWDWDGLEDQLLLIFTCCNHKVSVILIPYTTLRFYPTAFRKFIQNFIMHSFPVPSLFHRNI